MNLLLQDWSCYRRPNTGHPGLSCQWQQVVHHCQQQPEGEFITGFGIIQYTWCISMPCFPRSSLCGSLLSCSFSRLCLSAFLFLFRCVAAWPQLTFVHVRTRSCLKSLKSCRWVVASWIWCWCCVSCPLVFLNIRTCPSGQQDRWAALWIPPPTEGTFTSKNVHVCVCVFWYC